MRTYVAALMALVLVLTGHSMAIARGMTGPEGFAEYCIGESAVMVPVDADGNPTGPAHLCPEVSFSLLNWIAVDPPEVGLDLGRGEGLRSTQVTVEDVIRPIAESARAPPFDFL
ncbi:hypothetical protein [Shimia sagamensis]|uniref:hypothetical protein n=1 Tax=Shimia sagamensis TaxID=1566352 RepID=UPI0024B84D93|nr:hypothetical protein [Shimia sagamensis]